MFTEYELPACITKSPLKRKVLAMRDDTDLRLFPPPGDSSGGCGR